jgi:Tfp pilus assembly protein PilV
MLPVTAILLAIAALAVDTYYVSRTASHSSEYIQIFYSLVIDAMRVIVPNDMIEAG